MMATVLGFRPANRVVQRLLVIGLHIVLWGLFLTLPLLIYRIEILDNWFLYRELINKSFLILLFYFHYYFLIPRYFRKRRVGRYFLYVTLTLLVICIQQLTVEYYFQSLFRQRAGLVMAGRQPRMVHQLTPFAKATSLFRPIGNLGTDSAHSGRKSFGQVLSEERRAVISNRQDTYYPEAMPAMGRTRPDRNERFITPGFSPRFRDRMLMLHNDPLFHERRRWMGGMRRGLFMFDGPQHTNVSGYPLQTETPLMAAAGMGLPVMSFPFALIDSLVHQGILPLNSSAQSNYVNELPMEQLLMPPPGPFATARIPSLKIFGAEVPLVALPMIMMDTLTSAILILLISGFIKLANSLIISEKQKKVLENERLNAELNFLKLQINPHFLFNTLNSIYSQAHLKSEQTEYSILKFSQIMRYVLYDSTSEKIPLSKDLEYIRNYIDLQKLRISKNVTIHFTVEGDTDHLVIAPLLLITFIENAFKHGVSYSIPSEIRIGIAVTGRTLTLEVGNAVTSQQPPDESGGVGLINAKRRLDVLYPGRYLLDVVENTSLYIVNLKIDLDDETELPHH
ncbi:MAG: sensor histidine kinase [Candidatus Pseudobacter hemicellulosilyticus]|uniref:Sensor histidine kinase n=1 Tax=Candidatus Pseudobacter hemicellulosilyticus TaxID=3121375 RepID=A0AAJ6BGN0_9BACT|nr:MAG: sensor histidine kinase [Pseudobacter sp.]